MTTARGWSPAWAVTVAVLGVVIALVPLGYGLALLAEAGSAPGAEARGLAAALAQVALLYGATILCLLGWFLVRGGRVSFWSGLVLVVLGLAWYATLYLP